MEGHIRPARNPNMVDDYFVAPSCLRRYHHGPLAPYIDGLTMFLHDRGYKRSSVRLVLCLVSRFNSYAAGAGVREANEIDEALVSRFLRRLLAEGRFRDAPRAMKHMLEYLRRSGVVGTVSINNGAGAELGAELLKRYDQHLDAVRGLPVSTRQDYCRGARRLLRWLQKRREARSLGGLRGSDIVAFITDLAAAYPSGSWRNRLTSQTRLFLRFLRWEGTLDVDLDRVVPKVPHWRLASIPRHLRWDHVRALIRSIDVSTPCGLRDKVVLLLIAVLGMRGQEVRTLRLSDIAWRSAEIHLPQTKSCRARVLPLPHVVGTALAKYILHGRPRVNAPQVILRHDAPLGPLSSPSAVGRIVTRSLRRAKITPPARPGTQLLRHSLATRLVNRGVPIKQIADLLGHRSIDTTAIYSKVDLNRLAAVALPFPRRAAR